VDATTGTFVVPSEADVESGVTFGSAAEFTGALEVPAEGDVRDGIGYGDGGTEHTGNVELPAVGNVRDGTGYGALGTELEGTLELPAAGDVEDGVSFGADGTEYTGMFEVPAVSDVRLGIGYGEDGTEFLGTLFVPTGGALAVSLSEAKSHLRVLHTEDDTYIESLIYAVQAHAAVYQGRTYMEKTLTLTFDAFPVTLYMPGAPLVEITSIAYVDTGGASQTLDPSVYRVDIVSEPGRVTPAYNQSWPATQGVTNSVTVTYKAGYSSAADFVAALPAAKQAILLGVGHLYEHRETVTEENLKLMPMGFYDLLGPDRIIFVIPDGDGY
jgi:uncharacterized phiE125 gp8 family phage protein